MTDQDIYHGPLIAAHDAICDDRRCDPMTMGSLYPQVKAAVDVARKQALDEAEQSYARLIGSKDAQIAGLHADIDQWQKVVAKKDAEIARCWETISKIRDLTT